MDYESIKRLGLDYMNFDAEKSFETYDPTNANHIINLYLKKDKTLYCPHCGSIDIYSKGSKSQTIRYASGLEDNITLILHRRCFKCKDCNKYFKENNPFSETKKTLSLQKEIKILLALKDINVTYTSIANRFNVSPTFVINLFDKKVDIKRNKLTTVVCVDEVYSRKISRTSYCFVLYSPQTKTILDILNSRHSDTLSAYFSKITKEERECVKYFSIDLYNHYRIIAKNFFPKAKICADSFHVIKNLTTAFQSIRVKTMKNFEFLKNENSNYYWLYKKYWKLLLQNREDLSYKRFKVSKSGMYLTSREIIDNMLKLSPILKFAYELMQEYKNFNSSANIINASNWLDELTLKFMSSNIDEYIKFGKLLKNWHNEIVNSFSKVNGQRISNGPMERVNRDIKTIFRLSFGSTNFIRTRNRIMYTLNADAAMLYKRKEYTNKIKGKSRGKYKKTQKK